MSGLTALAAVGAVSAGVGIYNAVQSGKQTKFADSLASNQAGEQQGMYQMLMQLLENPASFASNPAYKFALSTGSATVKDNMVGSGYGGSGNEAVALQNFGQESAYSGLLSEEQLLASQSGLNASSSNAQNVSAATGASSNSFNQFLSMLPILGASIGGIGGGIGNLFSPAGPGAVAGGSGASYG